MSKGVKLNFYPFDLNHVNELLNESQANLDVNTILRLSLQKDYSNAAL